MNRSDMVLRGEVTAAIDILRNGIISIRNDGTPYQVGPTDEELNQILTLVIRLADELDNTSQRLRAEQGRPTADERPWRINGQP